MGVTVREDHGKLTCYYLAGVLFDIAGIWLKLNGLNTVDIFGMILESKYGQFL